MVRCLITIYSKYLIACAGAYRRALTTARRAPVATVCSVDAPHTSTDEQRHGTARLKEYNFPYV